jgi:hypothetical protein
MLEEETMRMGFRFGVLALLAALVLTAGGCGEADKGQAKGRGRKGSGADGSSATAGAGKGDHSGWWCDEHGIPEEECSMCSAKAARQFKTKGDWCNEHDRAKSQCFLCDPSLREKYAARYRAKYGTEPPEPTENQPPKEGGKKG